MSSQPDETHIAAGMTDGTLSVRRRQAKASEASADDLFSSAALRAGAYESFLGNLPTIGQGRVKSKQKSKPVGDVDEFRVESKRKKRLKEYDRFLKSFKYSDALDSVLRKVSSEPRINLVRCAHSLADRMSRQPRRSRSYKS